MGTDEIRRALAQPLVRSARRFSHYDGVMDEPACPGCRDLLQRVAELEDRVAELTRRLADALPPANAKPPRSARGPPKPDPSDARPHVG